MTRLEAALAELAAAIREEVAATTLPGAPDRLLTAEQAAEHLNVGRTTVYELMAAGRLRRVKVGRRTLVPSSALAELTATPPHTTAGLDLHRRSRRAPTLPQDGSADPGEGLFS